MLKRALVFHWLFSLLCLCACATESSSDSCATSSDCGAASVCARHGGTAVCAPNCSATASSCTGTASCEGLGVTSVNVCQEPQDPNMPESADKQPQLACVSDADCEALQPGTICASFRGVTDCTIPCSAETQCDVPSVAGVSFDFYHCSNDEAQTSRQACLPDPACIDNPTSCLAGFPTG